MTDVVLFHHAQGLTPGVIAFADRLRAAGHTVTTPDLYEGATFDALDAGIANVEATGFDTIVERARLATAQLPGDVVYIGFSLGVIPAQMLGQTRPGCRGVLAIASAVPADAFGDEWPSDVPLQIHAMAEDPFFTTEGDLETAQGMVESDDAELILYPGAEHLFMDESLPAYDAEATALLVQRVLAFLERVG